MKRKHSVGWHVVNDLNRKIKRQRILIATLIVAFLFGVIWFFSSGGR